MIEKPHAFAAEDAIAVGHARRNGDDQAVVLAPTEARYEPLADSTMYFDLTPGSSVKVLRSESGWSKIVRRDGRLGWVRSEHLEKVE